MIRSALDSARTVMALHPRDWAAESRDAWLWGLLVGWDESMTDVQQKHKWSDADVAGLRSLRSAVRVLQESTAPQKP